jgi:hypothetical protein
MTGLYALRGLTAPRPPQWLSHSVALHSHAIAPAQFVGPGNATHFLIRSAKTSYTAGTLIKISGRQAASMGSRDQVAPENLTEEQNWLVSGVASHFEHW